jgi:hypothetical protein
LTSKHPFLKEDNWQTIISIKNKNPKALPSTISKENKKIVEMLL